MFRTHLPVAVILALFSIPASALFDSWWRTGDAKYEPGDCITPTSATLGFYGHYARVEGVIGFVGKDAGGVYYLSFPVFEARTPLYDRAIEDMTDRVSNDYCEDQPS